jgi:hydrogenase maturation protein HypF
MISEESSSAARYRILFKGIVQGVGFRPFLYRSALKFQLNGHVKNTSEGVILEVEGQNLDAFVTYIFSHLPPLSEVTYHEVKEIPTEGSTAFEILASRSSDTSDLLVSPDIAVCENCKKELMDPGDRRYRYPFINCTDCGPRMTIIDDLPYDRPSTTMKKFPMCAQCEKEYRDPMDRRYHAQPVSCYHCGPILALYNSRTGEVETKTGAPLEPLVDAARKLKQGDVVAIKGLGGYHLACMAESDEAVMKMRRFKRRERKPFALMGTLEMIRESCRVSEEEEFHLTATNAPILLLDRKRDGRISQHVAPGQNTLGYMVPYTPLHIVLLQEVGSPLVMTSANISDEPIIYKDVLPALGELSDYVLTHDREINLFADDSVARVVDGKIYMVRRSRGYVPFPITIPVEAQKTVLALGPMMKTTFTMVRGNKAIVSPHIGDTDTPYSIEALRHAVEHYKNLFDIKPQMVVVDKHPGYPGRLLARQFPDAEIVEIQHHKAHVAALLAETNENDPVIGIAMDGTGYGDDGKIWGGEFFTGSYRNLRRYGHLQYLFLPSGDKSVKEPWRFALTILHSIYGAGHEKVEAFARRFGEIGEKQLKIISSGLTAFGVMTSSLGRVFDAAAVLMGIGDVSDFDGDLPSRLQAAAESSGVTDGLYRYEIKKDENQTILNLLPMFRDIIEDNRDVNQRAYQFHKTLAVAVAEVAERAGNELNIKKAGLTGGVFQNTLLLRLTRTELEKHGFRVLVHSEVPANDGGISLGQALLASAGVK